MKRVYFVRHGESEGNILKVYQGPEVPLSLAGRAGAEAVAERLSHLAIDVVVASHFVRARETAECIAQKIQKPLEVIDTFHEILNAQFVWGKRFDAEELVAYTEERKARFADPSWSPDGAENYHVVLERVKQSVSKLEEMTEENIVVVSHGNMLRLVASYLLTQKTDHVEQHLAVFESLRGMSNVGITEFVFDNNVWKMSMWNDHAHFAE